MEHERLMREALQEAQRAAALFEVPVGAVVAKDGQILARAGNRCRTTNNPMAHAEMLALFKALEKLSANRLCGCTLYVTLEPCPMCAGAIALSRLDAVFFGADDKRGGGCGSVYRLTEDPALPFQRVPAYGGILARECAALLSDFFEKRRGDA